MSMICDIVVLLLCMGVDLRLKIMMPEIFRGRDSGTVQVGSDNTPHTL